MEIKAKFENGYFMPLENVELNNGEIVDLNIVTKKNFFWRGALKHIKTTSIELQHKIKDLW